MKKSKTKCHCEKQTRFYLNIYSWPTKHKTKIHVHVESMYSGAPHVPGGR